MEKVLATTLDESYLGAKTVREFFMKCLVQMWTLGEGFSGKRVIAESDWQSRILHAVAGKEDLTEAEEEHYYRLVTAALRYMCL